MKKKILIFLSLVFLITAVPANSKAKALVFENNNAIVLRWDNVIDCSVKLTSGNNTVYIEGSVISIENKAVRGTVYLEKYTNGRWTSVTSWSISGTGTALLSKSYAGTSGYRYRARLSANVAGESISATSNIVSL